jgi:hypothetical protein
MQMEESEEMSRAAVQFWPLTTERWADFEQLFGSRGAYGGCWCMWWRLTRAEFEKQQGEGNRRAMRSIVESGEVPGVLAYVGDRVAGWCSIAARSQFASLNRSRVLKPLDDVPVWSLVCLFVGREHRGSNLAIGLIRGAVNYAAEQGARVVEAYPTVPRTGKLPPVSSFMGVPSMFRRVGFIEVAQPSESRIIMRYEIP